MTNPNPQRGETIIEIEGEERLLCLTLGALAEIEQALGCESLKDLSVRLKTLSAKDLIRVLAALLKGGGEADLAGRIHDLRVNPQEALRAILSAFGKATT